MQPFPAPAAPRIRQPFSAPTRALLERMDAAYDAVAAQYGFHCTGCRDNCCLTRFYHHTLIEYHYLLEGWHRLDPASRASALARSEAVIQRTAELERAGAPVRLMCPLNAEGRCTVYAHRPMICRLHGIAHELRRPDGASRRSPGCDAFTDQTRDKAYIPFDRTPLYMEMAALEREFRAALGENRKLRMTVAEMIRSFDGRLP